MFGEAKTFIEMTGSIVRGFVNWVYNHVAGTSINSDWTSAASIYYDHCTSISESEARPGDIVFWKGTYGSLDMISHVGIYCGNGITLDAGDPIGYDKVDSVRNMNGQTAERLYGRLVTLKDSPISINANNVKVHVADQMFTGVERTPVPIIQYAGSTLKMGEDFTVGYQDNVDSGIATIDIYGIGSYSGCVSANFEIYDPQVGSGCYSIGSFSDSSMVVDIPSASKQIGVAIQLYSKNNTLAQSFTFEKTNDGFYAIKNEGSRKYLALQVDSRGYGDVNSIVQDDYADDAFHKWSIKTSPSGGYVISSAWNGGYVFDVAYGVISGGSSVRSYPFNGTAAQRWSFAEAETQRG